MHLVQAEMHLLSKERTNVWAYGLVTIDRVVRFSIQVKNIRRQTGDETYIFAYPRRQFRGKWENVVVPDSELEEQIKKTVMAEIQEEISKDLYPIPMEVISLTRLEKTETGIHSILAIATVQICGLQIKGITVMRGKQGLFCNMPRYNKGDSGNYRDLVYGMTKAVRDQINQKVLEYYQGGNG